MDHPLDHQSSFDQHQHHQQQQQQQQNSQHFQHVQMMAMQGSPQIGSPLMHRNSYMQQHSNNYLTQQPTSPSHQQVHHYSTQQQLQQQQQHVPNPSMMHHGLQPQGQYNPQLQQHNISYEQHPQHFGHAQQPLQHPSNYIPMTGQRAKCDQVIYEAMAKACEIAVRGRCTNLTDETNAAGGVNERGYSDGNIGTDRCRHAPRTVEKRRSWNYGGGNGRGSNAAGGGGSSSTSSRFNIEVDEVPEVRSTVQAWKQAPHAPLRLDVYYEHDGRLEDGAEILRGEAVDRPPPPPQRELLERWCVDYVPSPSSNNGNSISSPCSSPSSSPYSSRTMTGSFASGDKSSNMSQLRQVCKRIVVLLRSLHCLTRMLPSHRLRCLLLSNMASGGGIAVNNGLVGGMAVPPPAMTALAGGLWSVGGAAGWGSIGFSIYVGDDREREPALPSPSFARQSFPSVQTPYGNLCLSVMYDATLNPNHMVADLVERRTEWLQRRWAAAEGGRQPRYQHHPPQMYLEEPPMGVAPTSTEPIPIIAQVAQQHIEHNVGLSTAAQTSNGCQADESTPGPREYGSCPPAMALMGRPASFGSAGRKTRAVSDFIITDYHYSPKLKSQSHSPAPSEKSGGGEKRRVMSGLSLAMMNNNADVDASIAAGRGTANGIVNGPQQPASHLRAHSTSPHEYGHYTQQQQEVDMVLQSFGSPATRAAFHNPPPLYSPGADIDLASAGMGYGDECHDHYNGTHFFHKHGGYGYGYNGSNMPLGEIRPPPPPLFMGGTPPTPQRGVLPAGSRSPSVTRTYSGDNGGYDVAAPPFPNLIAMQPPPSPGRTHPSGTRSTATSSLHANRHRDPNASPVGNSKGGLTPDGKGRDNVQQQSSRRRASSSQQSVHLLPPLTSLDVLHKSPFLAMATAERKTATNAGGEILGLYGEDDALRSSIPRMVSDDRNGSNDVSTLGACGGSSDNPSMPTPDVSSAAEGGRDPPGGDDSAGNRLAAAAQQAEELPFAVDDDDDPPTSGDRATSSGPPVDGGRSSLWGSTKADVLDGTIGGGGGDGGMAELASTLAVSSLHHRCAADGKVRLKMFEGAGDAREGGGGGLEPTTVTRGDDSHGGPTSDFDSIRDQLSEFRSFGASLTIGSADHHSQTDQ